MKAIIIVVIILNLVFCFACAKVSAESDKAIKQFNDNEISESSKQEIKEEWTVIKNDIIIGIDHGWSMMKTVTQVFVTGVKEITTTPALFGDVLEYEGKFYKVGTVRQEVKDTKVEDDSFYLLTLAAVVKELKRRGLAEAKVFHDVG